MKRIARDRHQFIQTGPTGFTIVDLIIAMALTVMLTAGIVLAAGESREAANRRKCLRNLYVIGQALQAYAERNEGAFPRTHYEMKKADSPTAFTGYKAENPFKEDGPEANDVSAAMFLLLRTQNVSEEAFICPASDAQIWDFGGAGKTAKDVSNWPSSKYLSYSYRDPYPSVDAVDTGYKSIQAAVDKTIPLAADGNPGGDSVLHVTANSPKASLAKANSRNHGGEGQNVLYGDGHVDWSQTPFCGHGGDNIYTFGPSNGNNGGKGIVGSPTDPFDTLLLPVFGSAAKIVASSQAAQAPARVTLPDGWVEVGSRAKWLVQYATNSELQAGFDLFGSSKEDYGSSMSLMNWAKYLKDSSKTNSKMKNRTETDLKEGKISDISTIEYEITGEVSDVKEHYRIFFFEKDGWFYELRCWTVPSRWEDAQQPFEQLIKNLK